MSWKFLKVGAALGSSFLVACSAAGGANDTGTDTQNASGDDDSDNSVYVSPDQAQNNSSGGPSSTQPSSNGSGGGSTSTNGGAAGGAQTGSGGGPTQTTTPSPTGGAGGGSGTSGSGPVQGYPAGPYGIMTNNTVAATLANKGSGWQCLPAGSSTPTTVQVSDFFDSDGSKGINAVVFDTSAEWCGSCRSESSSLEQQVTTHFKPEGVRVVVLMIQNADRSPADIQTAIRWRSQYNLNDVMVCAAPGFEFAQSGTNGLPLNVLVDPRSMVVKTRASGGLPGGVDQLAQANKK
jgi:thiol-disulfide isomerase/thioredoxin